MREDARDPEMTSLARMDIKNMQAHGTCLGGVNEIDSWQLELNINEQKRHFVARIYSVYKNNILCWFRINKDTNTL